MPCILKKFGERFPDMENALYNPNLRKKAFYETTSEIKAFRVLGADIVGIVCGL